MIQVYLMSEHWLDMLGLDKLHGILVGISIERREAPVKPNNSFSQWMKEYG
jgi:hypothetical protein